MQILPVDLRIARLEVTTPTESNDAWQWLNAVDFDAIALPSDKLEECRFFLRLLEAETDTRRFRWLISAFFGAAYSFFEIIALHAYEAFSDPESGESIPDKEALKIIGRYVRVKHDVKRPSFVKTRGLHPVTKALYELRNRNTHHLPLSIMKGVGAAPNAYQFGYLVGEGRPALPFCREVLSVLEGLARELKPHFFDF